MDWRITSPQVKLVINSSDSLVLEAIYRKRHHLSKIEWLGFLEGQLTAEKVAKPAEIKNRIKKQGRLYKPELDEQ